MRKRVLIVDDEYRLAKNLARSLDRAGFDAHAVHSVREARLALDREAVDVVCLDIALGDGDGLDLLEEFRPLYPNLAVVVMTCHGDGEHRTRAFSLGAAAFLPKPFPLSRLTEIVREMGNEAAEVV